MFYNNFMYMISAILPPGDEWENGNLLPLSFVFEHRLNKSFSPAVYADIVVATDRAPYVEVSTNYFCSYMN